MDLKNSQLALQKQNSFVWVRNVPQNLLCWLLLVDVHCCSEQVMIKQQLSTLLGSCIHFAAFGTASTCKEPAHTL